MEKLIKSYHDLDVWQQARQLVKAVYEITETFPKSEMSGLSSQMRRAAVSIPCNIAEGYSRHGAKDYAHFVSIAFGSAAELETQTLLALDLNFLSKESFELISSKLIIVQKMLFNLRQSLQRKIA